MNVVVVKGVLSSAPEVRELPAGGVVVNYEVTVRRAEGPAEGVPVVRYDETTSSFEAGAEVVVIGRVRRRFFRAAGATQSRTEVVAEQVLPVAQRRRIRTAIARAAASLDRWDEAG
jgi:single-strand DNA-binding protein